MGKEETFKDIEKKIAVEKFKMNMQRQLLIRNTVSKIFTFVICSLSITGIVFAKEISTKIYENKYLTGNGVGKAIEEGYIEKTETEYTESQTVSNDTYTGEFFDNVGIKIKVDDFMMDDFNLSITFDLEFDENVDNIVSVKDMSDIFLSDMIICDENKNILYHMNENNLLDFLKDNQMDLNYENTNEYSVVNCGVNSFPSQKKGNNVKLVYNIYSYGEFPKSKKIIINSKKVNVSKEESCFPGNGEITFNGKWNIELDVPEKMYNRSKVDFEQVSTTNKDYNIENAILYDTGFKIEGKFKAEKCPERPRVLEQEFYESLSDDDELKDINILNYIFATKVENTPEYQEYIEKSREINNCDIYLTTKDEKKIELVQDPNDYGGKHINEDGFMEFSGMYDLTKYDNVDELIVNIKYKNETQKMVLRKVDIYEKD